ncbi:MAG: sugar ABC transporter ATP-binding protein [Rectinemataceae bacterium]|jgi:ABC-type sugar transport system ATPase subunit
MADVELRMRGITKRFFSVTALEDVSLDLFGGEVHALVGENGAGKSTLMKILSGSYPSSDYEGEIEVGGKAVAFSSTHDAERAGIQMIYQEISLNLDLSVGENLFLGNLPRRRIPIFVNWRKTMQLAVEALARVGLDVKPREIVRRLSTSQQQLLSIAKALYRHPRILVLDEPTSALTETETQVLMRIISKLRSEGISCIYISHKLDEVFGIADRVTVLRDGHVISTTARAEVRPEKVIEDMVGRKIETMYPKVKLPLGEEVLRIENFVVPSRVPGKNIVEDLSFGVRAGEILGLGGLVGSGRSELVNAIFGASPRTSGRVFIDGKEVALDSPEDAIQHRMGLLTEDRRVSGFVGTMNIRENTTLASFPKIFGRMFIRRAAEKEFAASYFSQLKVRAPSIETSILSLSGGNQQKVVLAKWLMTGVRLLFLDEPTRGIDVGAKVEIYSIMTELARSGVAIVMISSELPELLAMCDRFVVLAKGRLSGNFTCEEISDTLFMKAATGLYCKD